MSPIRPHGEIRGFDRPLRSRNFEGLYGRMFRNLPAAEHSLDALEKLSKEMISEIEPVPEGKVDPTDSPIPAGYSFLGQFIAHDLTFDPASSLQHDNDPDALLDYRTPRFDLDCIYGRGPADQPYLYDKEGRCFMLGRKLNNRQDWDVPRARSTHRAIIADPRNDENVIIIQLHALFLRFHNKLARETGEDFRIIQRRLRWHYQWVVLDDYLRKIVDDDIYNEILPHAGKSNALVDPPQLRFYKVHDSAYMPVEFSAAAFRFGHSTIRHSYFLNHIEFADGPWDMFAKDHAEDLLGFRGFNRTWGVDWSVFLPRVPARVPADQIRHRMQYAKQIGPSLSAPLSILPPEVSRHGAFLTFLNLTRGLRLGLPSGQTVSSAMGYEPLKEEELTVGPPNRNGKTRHLGQVSDEFRFNAPLWYYILAEAFHRGKEGKLGPVGSRIVMETFVGLLMQDGHSFLRVNPIWKPKLQNFGMSEFVIYAITPDHEGPALTE